MTPDQLSFLSQVEGLRNSLQREDIKEWLAQHDFILQDTRLMKVMLDHLMDVLKKSSVKKFA